MKDEVGRGLRMQVAERAYHLCEYCLVHEDDLYNGCEVDHIRSRKHDGPTVADNLAFACFHCNRHKGTDLGSISNRSGQFVRFYHPRQDRWDEHFDLTDGRIEPLTEVGAVTVRVLEMNHPERVAFRKLLGSIGRYPTVEALALRKS